MTPNHYRRGRDHEYTVRNHMETAGWLPIMRASSSKGAADLLLAHPEHGPALVQVGGQNKTLSPADRTRLLHAAALCSALPILAIVIPRHGIHYWHITNGRPGSWDEWQP